MSRKKNKVVSINKKEYSMTDFERVPGPDVDGVVGYFENNVYYVVAKLTSSYGYGIQNPFGQTVPMEMINLLIIRKDGRSEEISYEEKQWIKNSILGDSVEAAELFPASNRELKEIKDNYTLLWVFPPDVTIPFGLFPVEKEIDSIEKFKICEDDLNVCIVPDGNFFQVFSCIVEAREAYDNCGNKLPENVAIEFIDNVYKGANVVWSEKAKERVDFVLSQANRLSRLINEEIEYDDIGKAVLRLKDYISKSDEDRIRNYEEDAAAGEELRKIREEILRK